MSSLPNATHGISRNFAELPGHVKAAVFANILPVVGFTAHILFFTSSLVQLLITHHVFFENRMGYAFFGFVGMTLIIVPIWFISTFSLIVAMSTKRTVPSYVSTAIGCAATVFLLLVVKAYVVNLRY